MNPRQTKQIAETIDRLIKANMKNSGHTFKRGIITQANSQKADVQIEGNTIATAGIIALDSYKPVAGDKVLILSIGETGANLVILGKLNANPTASRWIPPTLLNGWVNYGDVWSTAGYFKTSDGIVHLKGLVKNGTAGTTIFQLPVGYRPDYNSHIVTTSSSGWADINITTAGNVNHRGTTTGWFSLDGISIVAGA